jgi:TPR repeat protein
MRNHRTPSFAPALLLLLPSLSGCGPGAAAEAIRPNDPTAASALGEAECHEVGSSGEPLVVDWKPEERGDLEIAMKEGVAVVAYSCTGIKLLKDCHVGKEDKDAYGFMGMTRKEQVVRLQNADEVRANLPLSGATIGGELERGSTLEIAMVLVGKTKTTREKPTKADLKGECDGATHYVRGAMVGAFAMDTGTSAKVRAAVEIFGASAGAGSSSGKQVQNKEGDISDCTKATPSSDTPPAQCGAPIRLVLHAIAKDAPAEPTAAPEAKGPAIEAPEQACPKGLVLSEGKCTAAATAAAYQCAPDNAEECKAQCDKGHAGSCGTLGALHATGRGAQRDEGRAAELFKKACDGGEVKSCVHLGMMHTDGLGVGKDPAAAAKLFEKGCSGGEAAGCGLLGKAYLAGAGVSADPARAASLLEQGCNGADDKSCGALGALYAEGNGVQRDAARAAKLYQRACYGSDAASCSAGGLLYETGNGVGKSPIIAGMMYQRACFRANWDACADQGRVELAKPGSNADMARRAFEMGCNFRSTFGCAVLKAAYGQNKIVAPDPARQQALRKSCSGGNARDCGTLGVLQIAQGLKQPGMTDLQMACTRGDAFACNVAKMVK